MLQLPKNSVQKKCRATWSCNCVSRNPDSSPVGRRNSYLTWFTIVTLPDLFNTTPDLPRASAVNPSLKEPSLHTTLGSGRSPSFSTKHGDGIDVSEVSDRPCTLNISPCLLRVCAVGVTCFANASNASAAAASAAGSPGAAPSQEASSVLPRKADRETLSYS